MFYKTKSLLLDCSSMDWKQAKGVYAAVSQVGLDPHEVEK